MSRDKETKTGLGCCSVMLVVVVVIAAWQIFGWAWNAANLSLRYPWIIGVTIALCNVLAAIGYLGFAAGLPSSTFWKVTFVTTSIGLLAGAIAAYALRPTVAARAFLQCYLVGLGVLYILGSGVVKRIRRHHARREARLLRELESESRRETR